MVKRALVRIVAIVVLVGLFGFGGTTAILAQSQNCALTLQGQEYHISGGSGGIVLNVPPGPVVAFEEVAEYLASALPDMGGQSVAILVVDDFNGKKPEEFLPDTMTLVGAQISHGDMVYQHINRTIETLIRIGVFGGSLVSHDPAVETHWILEPGGGTMPIELFVVPVSASGPTPPDPAKPALGYDTKSIAANISEKIGIYSDPNGLNIRRFVVNMSFTVLPCTVVETFLSFQISGGPTNFDAFVKQNYLAGNGALDAFRTWFEDQIELLNDNDPLIDGVGEQLLSGGDLSGVFVAAAGNFGTTFDFTLYPGRWNEIVSVSGYEGPLQPQPHLWMDSNIGEVMMPAAWYRYYTPDGIETNAYYAGTSFAAPVMSVLTALWLSQGDAIAYPFDEAPPLFACATHPILSDVPSFEAILATTGLTC